MVGRLESGVTAISKKSKPTHPQRSSESTKARNAPIPASTRVPAQLYAFTPFPNEDWEAATRVALQPAVSDLRDRFVAHVKGHFEKSEECFAPELSGAYAADIDTIRRSVHQSTLSARDELLYYHNRGHEAQILAQHVGRLQKWIAADAIFPASEFRKMAARNAVSGDPLNWAYGQIRSVLYEFLGMPRGNRLGYWLDRVCDGRPAVNSDLFATPHEWVKAQLSRQASALPGYPAFVAVYLYDGKPPEWLPAHLLPPRPPSENTREDWRRLDKKMSEEVLGKFVHDFWEDLDAKIIDNMRNIRISLAQLSPEIIPAPTPASSAAERLGIDRAMLVETIRREVAEIAQALELSEDYDTRIRTKEAFAHYTTVSVCNRHQDLREKLCAIKTTNKPRIVEIACEIAARSADKAKPISWRTFEDAHRRFGSKARERLDQRP